MRLRAKASPDTRTRIVEAARFLFWEKGFGATGLAELLERAEANSGSFYHFFESKDALLREVLATYAEQLVPHLMAPIRAATEDPLDRVFALLEGYRQRILATECRYGCPIGRLALEVDAENTPARQLLARNFDGWKAAVEAELRSAGVPDAREAAILVLSVMEGGVMQARAHQSVAPFDASVRQLRLYLGARRPRAGRSWESKKQKSKKRRVLE